MYDRVEKAQDDSKSLDESLKELTKELQTLYKEKETVEAQQTKALKKKTKLELDVKDFQDQITGNIQSKVLPTWWRHMWSQADTYSHLLKNFEVYIRTNLNVAYPLMNV